MSLDTDLQIGWATPAQKKEITSILASMGRQTMNLRSMPDSRLIIVEANDRLVGWGGISTQFNPQFPELFSLHVDPEFRSLKLGSFIEYLRCTEIISEGFDRAYIRMTKKEDYWLHSKRIESSFYQLLKREDLPKSYTSLCKTCNIFETQCKDQIFLALDLKKFLEHHQQKFEHLFRISSRRNNPIRIKSFSKELYGLEIVGARPSEGLHRMQA